MIDRAKSAFISCDVSTTSVVFVGPLILNFRRIINASLRLGAAALACVSEMKDHGVIIGSKLTFTSHIHLIVSQVSIRANLIQKCFVFTDMSTPIRA